MKKSDKRDILYLNLAVMMFGIAGVIGQYVEVPSVMVALGRVICSSIILLVIALVKKESLKLESKKDYALIIFAGAVLALHWTSFFQSVQVSSVAIGTITFSTFPLFLTFSEPIIYREKLSVRSIVSAIVLLIGVVITIPEFSMENQVTIGIVWGMLSSLTYAIITLANRYFSGKYQGRIVSLYEQGTAAIVLLPSLFFVKATWRTQDIIGVVLIGCICTAFAYSLYISAQKKVKAQTAGLISGMETVYGILYAFVLLSEIPTVREIIGGVVILSVGLYSSLKPDRK
jgi:drug/metabolite transporter (DMT)-like permease